MKQFTTSRATTVRTATGVNNRYAIAIIAHIMNYVEKFDNTTSIETPTGLMIMNSNFIVNDIKYDVIAGGKHEYIEVTFLSPDNIAKGIFIDIKDDIANIVFKGDSFTLDEKELITNICDELKVESIF